MQVHLDGAGVLFLGFLRDVFYGLAVGILHDVVLGHLIEVANSASEHALEDEDIPLALQVRLGREVKVVNGIPLLGSDVDGRAVFIHTYLETTERIVGRVSLLHRPVDEGTDDFHGVDQVVLTTLFRIPVLGDGGIYGCIFFYGLALAFFVNCEKLVLVTDEVTYLFQLEIIQRFEGKAVAGVEFVTLEDTFHYLIVSVAWDREICSVDKLLVAFEEGVLFLHRVVFREHDTIHDVLCPAFLYTIALGGLEFFEQGIADVINFFLCLLHGDHLFCQSALVDDNLVILGIKVLGEDEYPGLHSLGECPAAELD